MNEFPFCLTTRANYSRARVHFFKGDKYTQGAQLPSSQVAMSNEVQRTAHTHNTLGRYREHTFIVLDIRPDFN